MSYANENNFVFSNVKAQEIKLVEREVYAGGFKDFKETFVQTDEDLNFCT
jgi:hypothetical protein